MKDILNPVALIKFVALPQVISYQASRSGKANLQYSGLTDIPFAKGTVTFSCTPSTTPAGTLYTSSVNSNVKLELPSFKEGVLLITLESEDTLIIGEPEIPIRILAPENLMQKTFQVSYKSWHSPFILAI